MTPLARRATLGIAGATIIVALLSLLSPGLRHQLDLSLSRQSESFLELAFAHPEAARACTVDDGTLAVGILVEAHGERAGDVPVAFEVVSNGDQVLHQRTRQIATVDGRPTEFTETLPVPVSGAFTVRAKIADSDEFVRLGCRNS